MKGPQHGQKKTSDPVTAYDKAPYVCNGCAYLDHCARMHTYYSAELADKTSREAWGSAHAGALITREELARYDALIKDALTRGMSLYALYQTNRPTFGNQSDARVDTRYR